MDTTILLNQPVKYMASMFEKELKTYYRSLNLSCLHMVLEEKSTAHKFLSFQYMTCTNSCPNEEGYGGQNEDQPDIGTA